MYLVNHTVAIFRFVNEQACDTNHFKYLFEFKVFKMRTQ